MANSINNILSSSIILKGYIKNSIATNLIREKNIFKFTITNDILDNVNLIYDSKKDELYIDAYYNTLILIYKKISGLRNKLEKVLKQKYDVADIIRQSYDRKIADIVKLNKNIISDELDRIVYDKIEYTSCFSLEVSKNNFDIDEILYVKECLNILFDKDIKISLSIKESNKYYSVTYVTEPLHSSTLMDVITLKSNKTTTLQNYKHSVT